MPYMRPLEADLPCGMDKKQTPCIAGVENGRPDGFPIPSGFLPARFNLQDRQARIVAGEDGEFSGVFVELLRQVAQAESGGGDVFQKGGGKEAAVGDMYRGVTEGDPGVLTFVTYLRRLFAAAIFGDDHSRKPGTGDLEEGARLLSQLPHLPQQGGWKFSGVTVGHGRFPLRRAPYIRGNGTGI